MIDHYDRSDNVFTEKNINAYIRKTLVENWDKEAFTDYKSSTLLYRDVARRVAKLHILFEEAGLQPGDIVKSIADNYLLNKKSYSEFCPDRTPNHHT